MGSVIDFTKKNANASARNMRAKGYKVRTVYTKKSKGVYYWTTHWTKGKSKGKRKKRYRGWRSRFARLRG